MKYVDMKNSRDFKDVNIKYILKEIAELTLETS